MRRLVGAWIAGVILQAGRAAAPRREKQVSGDELPFARVKHSLAEMR